MNSDIDDSVDKIDTILLNSAKQTFGVAKKKPKRKQKCTPQPWFDAGCKRKRNEYHIASYSLQTTPHDQMASYSLPTTQHDQTLQCDEK